MGRVFLQVLEAQALKASDLLLSSSNTALDSAGQSRARLRGRTEHMRVLWRGDPHPPVASGPERVGAVDVRGGVADHLDRPGIEQVSKNHAIAAHADGATVRAGVQFPVAPAVAGLAKPHDVEGLLVFLVVPVDAALSAALRAALRTHQSAGRQCAIVLAIAPALELSALHAASIFSRSAIDTSAATGFP